MDSENLFTIDLLRLGIPEEMTRDLMDVLTVHYMHMPQNQKKALAKRLIKDPAFYKDHELLSGFAKKLMVRKRPSIERKTHALKKKSGEYPVYGKQGIDDVALHQMDVAMKLPVTLKGALMPDAHPGYGLPIGGVLATENAVIPYGVGVDIGCRMRMSAFQLELSDIDRQRDRLSQILLDNTRFGRAAFERPKDHPVLDRTEFREIRRVRELLERAREQIGSSGGGNHFVEFGVLEIRKFEQRFGLTPGKYVALLSHSGSRGMGAEIARYYTQIAQDKCKLAGDARQLAWLSLDSEEGQEYWKAMNLAGDYASACHQQIHERIAGVLGETPVANVENHHNFAWKESDVTGRELVVHRKGATPAGKDVLGVIPGSMTSPGFLVKGKGNDAAINSAAHGAGRVMSRRQAKKTLSEKAVTEMIRKAGVSVIGSGLDEAPVVYKDIREVMRYQEDLVEVIGLFWPKIVRMCGDKKYIEVD